MITHKEAIFHFTLAEDGVLRWRVPTSRNRQPGDKAGTVSNDGYRAVKFKGRDYRAHRLAWFMVKGEWPSGDLASTGQTRKLYLAALRDADQGDFGPLLSVTQGLIKSAKT